MAGTELAKGDADPAAALRTKQEIWVEGGEVEASVYDRGAAEGRQRRSTGPAIVTEMDSTTLVLPGHAATVHPSGSLLIRPSTPNPED